MGGASEMSHDANKTATKGRSPKAPSVIVPKVEPLWTGAEWTPELLEKVYAACEKIGVGELGLSLYPNQIEIISSEQMLDAYSSTGMPILYNHWSFGKHFSREWDLYKKGKRGLAYELVINSSPCINYLMEENTMTMQCLVIAHAAFGHNHFFKNNHLFRQWTDAEGIIDYLVFAKDYVAKCEEREGKEAVEDFLDACHALQSHGVDRFRRAPPLSAAKERMRQREREEYKQSRVSPLDRLIPQTPPDPEEDIRHFPKEPEENILYFCEKYAPDLRPWQRELIRIVRKMAQYFMPQQLTKVGNEGCASWTHWQIMNKLHERGLTTDGAHLEFLTSHTSVLFQPGFDSPYYSGGLNPYVLGFNILRDIERASVNPDDEDRVWLSTVAGCGDPYGAVREAAESYRDESLIRQFLSPKVMRDMRLFRLHDPRNKPSYEVSAIHNERGYHDIRETLADRYEWHESHPQIEVVDVEHESRHLTLRYTPFKGRYLDEEQAEQVMQYVRTLWSRSCTLIDNDGDVICEAY